MSCQKLLALVFTAAFVLTACGDDDDATGPATTEAPGATTTTTGAPTTTSDSEVSLGESCTHEERDVTIDVSYPDDWHVNEGDGSACSAFDPEPFELETGTQYPFDLAVVVRVEPVAFDRASQPGTARVEDERELEVDGRQAVRLEVVATGEALTPEGQRSVRYVIDASRDRSIIAETHDVEGNDFEQSTRVLDAMVDAFDITPAGG